jgi:hypothetical protein
MGLLYHIKLLVIFTLTLFQALMFLLNFEHLILTNVLITPYTFIAYNVVIIICICYCRLFNIERMFYINARI